MIRLYCRKHHAEYGQTDGTDVPGLPGAFRVRGPAQ